MKSGESSDTFAVSQYRVLPSLGVFTDSEISLLDQFTEELELEAVSVGDVSEDCRLSVGRVLEDRELPCINEANRKAAEKILEIVGSQKTMEVLQSVLGESELVLRRCQVNVLREGDFIGKHLDLDSNPDYLFAVCISFSDNFSGGDFLIWEAGKSSCVRYPKHSILLSRCDLEHEVTRIESGLRKTLVFFLAKSRGQNRSTKLIH